jgi:hypothetical protein
VPAVGPLLRLVIATQDEAFRATEYPAILTYAKRLVALASSLGNPVIWPVGEAAERLAGSAIVVGRGRPRVRNWSGYLREESVLLVCVAAATPLPLRAAAEQARALGAKRVDACGVSVCGIVGVREGASFGAYVSLQRNVNASCIQSPIAI